MKNLLIVKSVLVTLAISLNAFSAVPSGKIFLPNTAYELKTAKAWDITKGDKKVVVAVIDTGIDADHPDLKNNLWKDPKTGNYGWDFTTNKPNPKDVNNHGTHVAGIINAVAPNVSLMVLKYYDVNASESKNLENEIKAFEWAIDHGANIINFSGGGPGFNDDEFKVMKKARDKGVVIVAAAGNNKANVDVKENAFYPAAYALDNIVSVGSVSTEGKLSTHSNYGKTVNVIAPGDRIYSTFPGSGYGLKTGTSQATGFVSGVAALMLSLRKDIKAADIKQIIIDSVDKLDGLKGKVSSEGKVNAFAALEKTKSYVALPPVKVATAEIAEKKLLSTR